MRPKQTSEVETAQQAQTIALRRRTIHSDHVLSFPKNEKFQNEPKNRKGAA
jgi:hypothetical protein